MSTPVLRRIATVTALLAAMFAAGSQQASAGSLPRGAAAAAASSQPAWLAEINRYRAAAGLNPVVDNPAWDLGIAHHLTYLAKTPSSDRTGQYASAHTENPASPYYTPDGNTEAHDSDLQLGGATTPLAAVDSWLAAPFHAVGMLRAQLTAVALDVDPTTGYAGLDVIQGLNPLLPPDPNPILFPGPGITTNLLTYTGDEFPDPLQTCHWTDDATYGLPLILLLPQPPGSPLQASLSGPGGTESTANGKLCVVDQNTYYSTDPIYGPTGLEILEDGNAVFLFPRHPLSTGTYSVAVQQPGQAPIDWSFSAAAAVRSTSILGVTVHGHTVHVQIATPAGTRLRCALTRRGRHGFGKSHFKACSTSPTYRHVKRGRYRFTVESSAGIAGRQLSVF